MPVKVWERDDIGLHSRVYTGWDTIWSSEEYRGEAEQLDKTLDKVLDYAVTIVESERSSDTRAEFIRAWAIGHALRTSDVFESPALKNETHALLWKALAAKCRLGTKADGQIDEKWRSLRPEGVGDPDRPKPRREGGRLDYFEMCVWLAEQSFSEALATFGGSIRNAWQMLERPSLNTLNMRRVVMNWFNLHDPNVKDQLFQQRRFADIMKQLRRQWPSRGPGSAKRPIHYSDADLTVEIKRALSSFADFPMQAANQGRQPCPDARSKSRTKRRS
jgi:hypothetical protein